MKGKERFPIGLTLAALVVFAICAGLGVWQLQRAAWKARVLGQIAARARAPAQPIGPVLARAAHGEDVAFTRVAVKCGPSKLLETGAFLSGVDAGQWAWHPIAYCGRPAWERYDSIPVDRGVLDS